MNAATVETAPAHRRAISTVAIKNSTQRCAENTRLLARNVPLGLLYRRYGHDTFAELGLLLGDHLATNFACHQPVDVLLDVAGRNKLFKNVFSLVVLAGKKKKKCSARGLGEILVQGGGSISRYQQQARVRPR